MRCRRRPAPVGGTKDLTLTIHVPDALRFYGLEQLEALATETLLVELYRRGAIGSGFAAEALGISRRAFLDRLSTSGVSAFDDEVDLDHESALA